MSIVWGSLILLSGNYRNPNIVNETTIKAVNRYFNQGKITFLQEDFEKAVEGAKQGDFVYFDPPYMPISKTSNFTGYSEGTFGEKEQIRLKEVCDSLRKKKVNFLVSNSDCEFIHKLYEEYEIIELKAKRSINCDAGSRGQISEVLVRYCAD